jgi:putative oxidoreductase
MKSRASFTILMDQLERFSALLLRLALGAAFIAAAVDCIRFTRAGGEVTFLHSFQLPAVLVWAAIALEIMTGCALIVGFHIRAVDNCSDRF